MRCFFSSRDFSGSGGIKGLDKNRMALRQGMGAEESGVLWAVSDLPCKERKGNESYDPFR